jgi:hypothetical protein
MLPLPTQQQNVLRQAPQQPYYQQQTVDWRQQQQQTPQGNWGFAQEQNTSGQGSTSIIPDEIEGWNWGALFLSVIWGLRNNVLISLLCLIPLVGIVIAFVLGANGNKWAWQKKSWDSIEHFQKTQRTWAVWGTVIFVISILLGLFR